MPKRLSLIIPLLIAFFIAQPLAKTETLPIQLLYQKNGTMAGEVVGFSVGGGGDMNGDAIADFIIGAPGADTGGIVDVGAAYVYSGANGALPYTKNGTGTDDELGLSVAVTGDINGDGRADFIVSAYLADPLGRVNAGSAFVYSGLDGSLLYQKHGGFTGDRLGGSVAGAGDVNADGREDFIVGAEATNPGGRINAGSAYVYSGATGALLYQKDGMNGDDAFGWSVAGAGDVNGDGKDDFIIGAPFAIPGGLLNAGSAYVYSGSTGALLHQKDGVDSSNYFGGSVAGAGDLNGDLKSDFIVGAPGASPGGLPGAGSVYVYSGADGSVLYQKNGSAIGDDMGDFGAVAGAGDVNGDGRPDFIIGAYYANPGGRIYAGSAFVYSGMNGSLLFQIDGAAPSDFLGSVAGAGDINADGKADVIVGASGADPGGLSDAGSAYVYGLVSTDVPKEGKNRPAQFELSQNYPNPFNPTTTIRYYLPKREKVTLEIFNLLGEQVKVLANEEQPAGEHALTWNGTDERGKVLPSGIYFYRLKGQDFSETKKMLFLK